VRVLSFDKERPGIIVATDVNGTTTPHNTFAEIVRPDGLFDRMEKLVGSYTSGNSSFSAALPRMRHLASAVDREGLETYARTMPLYRGVTTTIDKLIQSENVDAKVALSTTGFAGLMALVNKFRHGSLTAVAASPVLDHLLNQEEQSCLIRPITDEKEKVHVLDDLTNLHRRNWHLVFHIGDTMGDFPAIKHAAELGGIGIAFRPNKPLKASISGVSKNLRRRICEIDFVPEENPDYNKVGDVIKQEVWKVFKVQL
jgi:phosphoserine phosphatase